MDQKYNILLAEDESIIALDLKLQLKNFGLFSIRHVKAGKDLIEEAFQETPDLIISDILLKDTINGIEANKEIRKEKNIPILFIAGNAELLKEAAATFPKSLTILKPIHPNILKEKCFNLLNS